MPDQNRPQSTPLTTSPRPKAESLDKTPGTLGANASNTGITIDLPSTVATTSVQTVAQTPVAESSDLPRTAPVDRAPSGADTAAGAPVSRKEGASTSTNQSHEAATPAPRSASALLHAAGDKAAESYAHLAQSADELAHRTGEAIGRAYGETRRAGSSVGHFASTHTLPLLLIGTGLAWLSISVRKERRFAAPRDVEVLPRRPVRREVDARSRYPEVRRPVYVEGTAGSKLLAVPVHETHATRL